MLARHLDPLSGTYRLAEQDAQDVSVASVRARIAFVDDEPHAFAGTVRANLALASPEADDPAMVQVLRSVDLGRWLTALPQGLDIPLAGLSGGERARLSMARAVLSRRPIVLLDEPTTHLDDATAERAIAGVCTPLVTVAPGSGDREHEAPGPAVVAVSHRPLPWTGFERVEVDGHPAGTDRVMNAVGEERNPMSLSEVDDSRCQE